MMRSGFGDMRKRHWPIQDGLVRTWGPDTGIGPENPGELVARGMAEGIP